MARREKYYQARIRVTISNPLKNKMKKEGRLGSLNEYIEEILFWYLTKAQRSQKRIRHGFSKIGDISGLEKEGQEGTADQRESHG